MTQELALSEDGYLLSKIMSKECLKTVVDTSNMKLDFEIPFSKNKREDRPPECDFSDSSFAGRRPTGAAEEWYVQELYKYLTPKKEGDIVCWYDDIRILSGSAGYILLRDGYVISTSVVWRS